MLFMNYNKLRNVQTLNLVIMFYFLTVNLPEHLASRKWQMSSLLPFPNCGYVHMHST